MMREDFLAALSQRIAALPADEKNTVYEYYNEIYLDKKENGMDEEEIIAEFGDIDEIAAKILSEYPPDQQANVDPQSQRTGSDNQPYSVQTIKRRSTTANVLIVVGLILGSPIWVSLLAAFFAVVFAVVVSVYSILIALWAVVGSLLLAGLICVICSFIALFQNPAAGLIGLGTGFVSAGLGLMLTVGMIALSKYTGRFTGWMFVRIGRLFHRKSRPDVMTQGKEAAGI